MERKKGKFARIGTPLIVLLAVVTFSASLVFAKYVKTVDLPNNFFPAQTDHPGVVENFKDNVKEDVRFTVDADPKVDYLRYLRVAVVITWKNEDDVVLFTKPVEGKDYTIRWGEGGEGLGTDWVKGDDGYYYYTKTMNYEDETSILVKHCAPIEGAIPPEEGYTLSVEFIVQTVQAVGYTDDDKLTAWKDAWAGYPS